AFGADKEEGLAGSGQVLHELGGVLEHLEGLLQVDDVNAVALAEDVLLHLGIPALGLVPEVDARFEQLLHGDVRQSSSSLICILHGQAPRDSFPVSGEISYRFEYWNRLRAPFCPYFLRSLERESRVSMPALFSLGRSSGLNPSKARAMPSLMAPA